VKWMIFDDCYQYDAHCRFDDIFSPSPHGSMSHDQSKIQSIE